MSVVELWGALEARLSDSIDQLKELVGINSHSNHRIGVNQCGDFIAKILQPWGFADSAVQAGNPHYGNHRFFRRNGKSRRGIVLVSHLDTVYPPETSFVLQVDEGADRIYGPGVVDIKGGTILILMMLDALRTVRSDVFEAVNWLVALNAAEERLEPHFAECCASFLPEDPLAALVFEVGPHRTTRTGDVWDVVTKRMGRMTFSLNVHGKEGHAGNDFFKAPNALAQAALIASKITALAVADPEPARRTAHIAALYPLKDGKVMQLPEQGEVNRIPGEAVIAGEMRAFDESLLADGREQIQRIVEEANVNRAAWLCGTAECSFSLLSPTWEENAKTQRLASVWEKAGRDLATSGFNRALTVNRAFRAGLSDANFLYHRFGLPVLDGLGPDGGNLHSSQPSNQEYVVPSSFVPKALLNLQAILSLIEQ